MAMFNHVESLLCHYTEEEDAAAAATKSLQLFLILCDPIDGSPPGSPILHG